MKWNRIHLSTLSTGIKVTVFEVLVSTHIYIQGGPKVGFQLLHLLHHSNMSNAFTKFDGD